MGYHVGDIVGLNVGSDDRVGEIDGYVVGLCDGTSVGDRVGFY